MYGYTFDTLRSNTADNVYTGDFFVAQLNAIYFVPPVPPKLREVSCDIAAIKSP